MKIIELINTCAREYLEKLTFLESAIENYDMRNADNQEFLVELTTLCQSSRFQTLIENNNLNDQPLSKKEIQVKLMDLRIECNVLVNKIVSELEKQITFKEKANYDKVIMFLCTAAWSILRSYIKLNFPQDQQALLLSLGNLDAIEIGEELFCKAFSELSLDSGSRENSLTQHSPLAHSPSAYSPSAYSPSALSDSYSSTSSMGGRSSRSSSVSSKQDMGRSRSNSVASNPGTPDAQRKKDKRRTLTSEQMETLNRILTGYPSTNSTSSKPANINSKKLPSAEESFIPNTENTDALLATLKHNEELSEQRIEQVVKQNKKERINKFKKEHPIRYGAIKVMQLFGANAPRAFHPRITISPSAGGRGRMQIPDEILEHANQNIGELSTSSSSNQGSTEEENKQKRKQNK